MPAIMMGRASNAVKAGQCIMDQANVNSCLKPIKTFSSVVKEFSNVHPLSFGAHVANCA